MEAERQKRVPCRRLYVHHRHGLPWVGSVQRDGVYFLQNRQTEGYMQVDDDDAPNYTNNGGIMEIHPFDGENCQRWDLFYLWDGYYRIESAVSGYAVTVPAGDETDDNTDLILKPYTGSDNRKWRVTMTRNGSYKIKAKSSESYAAEDLVMDLETALYTNGVNIRQREYLDNASYKDEWYFVRMLPTNGSELVYNQAAWTTKPTTTNNCYAYAINNQVYPGSDYLWFRPQMGEYRGENYIYSSLTEANIYTAVVRDFNTYNEDFGTSLTFRRIGRYDVCPEGTYKVALVASGSDYHWYRQDADGLWSHKRGTTAVQRTDDSGQLIIDPYIADRGDYTQFLGYYAVSPWNGLFTANGTTYCYVQGDIVPYTDLMGYLAATSGIAASVSSLTFSEEELAEIASRMPTFTYEGGGDA